MIKRSLTLLILFTSANALPDEKLKEGLSQDTKAEVVLEEVNENETYKKVKSLSFDVLNPSPLFIISSIYFYYKFYFENLKYIANSSVNRIYFANAPPFALEVC
jgi:hypothetical protein